MAFINKKVMSKPGEVVVEPPPPVPGDDPPPPPLPPDVLEAKPPTQVKLIMSTDGGLNGQCWRAGQMVVMDASAADFYLAKGYAKRAP